DSLAEVEVMGALYGKSVVFTGAASGIGRAVVARYVAEGARVVAVDTSGGRLGELATELGPSVVPVVGDAGSWDDNVRAVRAAVDEFGGVDVFVGNAGIHDGAQDL